jgi:hypothetical protein
MRGSQTSMSAVTAALQSEDEEDSDLDEDTVTDSQSNADGPDNPRWQLYNAVRSANGSQGIKMLQKYTFTNTKKENIF